MNRWDIFFEALLDAMRAGCAKQDEALADLPFVDTALADARSQLQQSDSADDQNGAPGRFNHPQKR